MKMKIFSLEEANRLIPALKPLMEELRHKYQKMEESSLQWEVHHRREAESVPSSRLRKTRDELARLEEEVKEILQRIEQMGCVIRDPHEGLLDFPGVKEKEPIYLCWKLGEESIRFYHSPEDGFQGRKPITP